jgi:hypothetical protein
MITLLNFNMSLITLLFGGEQKIAEAVGRIMMIMDKLRVKRKHTKKLKHQVFELLNY